jgi:hypothetical protein
VSVVVVVTGAACVVCWLVVVELDFGAGVCPVVVVELELELPPGAVCWSVVVVELALGTGI